MIEFKCPKDVYHTDSMRKITTCKDLRKFTELEDKIHVSILIDDKISNNCADQNIYHMPKFNCYVSNNISMLKLFFYIIELNIKNDIKSYKKMML